MMLGTLFFVLNIRTCQESAVASALGIRSASFYCLVKRLGFRLYSFGVNNKESVDFVLNNGDTVGE